MTLKHFLELNSIDLGNKERFHLGRRIARIWDSFKLGKKITIIEDEYTVRDYPIEFLNKKNIADCIIKFLKNG